MDDERRPARHAPSAVLMIAVVATCLALTSCAGSPAHEGDVPGTGQPPVSPGAVSAGHGPDLLTAEEANALISASDEAWGGQSGTCTGADDGGEKCTLVWDGEQDPAQTSSLVRGLLVVCGPQQLPEVEGSATQLAALPGGSFGTAPDTAYVWWPAPDVFAGGGASPDEPNSCLVTMVLYSTTGADPLSVKDLITRVSIEVDHNAKSWVA